MKIRAAEKQTGVYAITNTVNGKQYIGSSRDVDERWGLHRRQLRGKRHHSRYLQRAWDKYGEVAFVFTIVETCIVDALLEREQHYLDTLQPAYNGRDKAQGGPRECTDEMRQKLSERSRAYWQDPEHRIAQKARMKALAADPEHRAKIAAGRRPYVVSAETKAKISSKNSGRRRTAETREKMSRNHNYDRVLTDELREKYRQAALKRWHGQDEGR